MVLVTSIFAGGTMAQETPTAQPEKPPITEEYRDQIIELLKETRVDDDNKRLEGLRKLEKVLLPKGWSQILTDTRQEIADTLAVQKLEEKLQTGNESEVMMAAEILAEEWIRHENYYIREQAKRILDAKFLENPDADPRNRPPDISAYIERAYNIKPVSQLSAWKDSTEVQEILKYIRDRSVYLDDNKYKTREKSTKELTCALIAMREFVHPLPEAVLEIFTAKHNETTWHPEWQSLEKRERSESVLESLESAPYTESKLPAMQSNVDQVIADMETHFGIHIDMPHISAFELQNIPFEVIQGCNSYSDILIRICEATKTYPVCGGHVRNITLVPIDSKKQT